MDNKYLDFLQSGERAQVVNTPVDQPAANPYADFLQKEDRKALRASLAGAMDVDPETAGKARKLAGQAGLPAAVVERNMPDVERQIQLQQFDNLLTESPRLARQLENTEFAKVARDDVDILKRMELKLYGGMKPIARGFFGSITEPLQRGFARARSSVSIIANELGLYDGAQEEFAVNLAQRNRAAERFPVPANVQDGLSEITQARGFGEAAGAIFRNPQSVLEVTLESLGASAPALGAAVAGSVLGPLGTAGGAGIGSFAIEYSNTLNEVITERGGSTTDAFAIGRAMANPEVMEAAREKGLKRGIPIALFDALTAGLAGRVLAGAKPSVSSVASRTAGEFGVQAAGGAAGETSAQTLTGEFNPGEILLEAFAEIPSAVIEVPANYRDARGQARMRETIAAAEGVQQKVQAQADQAQGAEQNAQTLRDLAQDSAASKVRERDPQAFEQYIERVVEDGPVQELYIDAQTLVNKLNQSGISVEELSQASPSVAAQISEALATGGDVVIPVSEYMARVAGTGLDEALIPSLRTDLNAMSEEQAQTFYQEQTQVFQKEADRVIGQQAQADEFTESANQVEAQLLEQLNKAGRFQPRANELKAGFAKSFYATLADSLGVTPAEAFARYPLHIRADMLPDLDGGGRFDQEASKNTKEDSIIKSNGDIRLGKSYVGYGILEDTVFDEETGEELNGEKYVLIEKIDVDPEKRRQGIARKLLREALVDISKKYPDLQIKLAMDPQGKSISPEDLAAFYESEGFVIESADGVVVMTHDGSTFNQEGGGAFNKNDNDVLYQGSTEQTETPEFKNWFGDSKVADPEGKPLVVYHGTTGNFNAFSEEKLGATTGAASANKGFFFTDDPEVAGGYSEIGGDREPVRGEYGGPEPTYQEVERLLSIANQGGPSIYDNPITGKKEIFPINRVGNARQLKALRDSMREGKSFKNALENDGSIGLAELFGGDYNLVEGVNGANVIPVFLSIKNPLEHDFKGDPYREFTYNDLLKKAKAEGRDGAVFYNTFDEAVNREDSKPHTVYVAFGSTQVKSATGNRGTFDPNDSSILNQGERGSIAFANDITQTPTVLTLVAGSDLSTFFHESGHFFLEVYSDLATREDAPSRVKADMAAILEWMGVKGSPELTPLQQWREMTLDERRPMHEKFARGFEAYLIKGEAPSLELRDAFRTFSAWIKNVYKGVLAQLRGNADKALDTNLSPEIRQVMDRMLATDAQIQQAEFARSMFPTFQTAEEAGQNQEQWERYQAQGRDATATAIEQLQRKSLADMKWFANAKGKAVRDMQKRAKEIRAQVRTDVRREVMTQPVYQAWAFFRSRQDMPANRPKPKAQNRELNPAVDTLFVAIGMLGGLDKDQLVGTWGFDPADRAESGVFGKPVVRVNKGRTLDDMLGVLAEWGYLPVDENGKPDLRDFEEAFFNELAGAPQYSMWADYSLQRPEEDAPEVPFDLANIPSGKLSTGWLKAKYRGNEAWRKLVGLKMTSGEAGLDPDVVAPSFDFDSGDAMVQALIAAEDPSVVIERLTDERMLQEFSELATPEQIERAAEAAIHNDARARFVATELEAVNQLNNRREQTQRGGTVNTIMKAAREFAEDILSRKKIRDIRPSQFANAEAKAGREAMAAQKAGDYAALAQAKRNQLLNTFAARGAVKALEEADKTLKYLKKFDSTNVRKGIPPEYQEQIDAILDDIGLRPMSNKQIDRLKSLDDWVKQQNELGFAVDIDQRLLDRAAQKQFRELTLQEMRAVRDAIKNIEHLGRKKKQYQVARDLRSFGDVRDEVVANIEQFGGKSKVVPFKADKGSMIDIGKGVRSFFAVNRKLSSLVQQMDGGQSGGIFWQSVVRKFNDAADYRQELQDEYFPKLEALLTRLENSAGKLLEKRFIPQLGFSFDTETRMAILLNWGNEQGRSRIMEGLKKPNGELFSTADVQVVLQTFTAEELRIANDMWALIDEFWPLVVEKQKRVAGITPDKVEAIPFSITASDGEVVQVRGGYYPLKYDSDKDGGRQNQLDTAATYDELKRGAYSHASTRRGHVEKRAETVERPIRLDLGVAVEHIVQVTQDLAFHEAIVDASRLLNDRKVKAMVLEKYGQEVWDTMNGAMVTIAQDGVLQTEKWMRLGNRLRNNVSRAIMGASMTTAFLQPFGFFNSMAKIGPRWVLNGVGNALSDVRQMQSSMQWVGEKSTFMRTRAKTFNAEMNSINSKLNGRSQLLQMYDTALFYTMQKLQMTVDVPTWMGAYNKYLSEGFEEDTAIALADQAVIDSQGSGLVKDQTEFQLNHPFLTQFYSYFAATYNLLAQKTGNTDFKNPRALMGWMSDVLFLVVMPSIAAEMVKALFKGDLEDDEPEEIALKSAKWLAGYTLGMLPLVRDLGGLISGFDYAGPPVARIVTNMADTSIQVQQGEVDQAMVGAFARTLGSLTGVPDVQLMRTYKGWVAWEEGDVPPTAILLGPPSKD